MSKQSFSLAAFYQAATTNNLPVALWQIPNSTDKQAVTDLSGLNQQIQVDFEQQLPGFAFSPFVNRNAEATLFIRASIHATQTGLIHHDELTDTTLKPLFLADYERFTASTTTARAWHTPDQVNPLTAYDENQFCYLVEQAIDYMNQTSLKKIVVSRAIEVPLPPEFEPISVFERLCQAYPRAFVSLVSIPHVGSWLGVSPEILLTVNDESLQTIALAGTQAKKPNIPLPEVQWGQKEIVEQALVSDYIRHFLHRLGIQNYSEVGPCTVAAGNIVHLKTQFTVAAESSRQALLKLGNQILDSLHPTSAVCGMPKREALDFILSHEGYDREFYAGFLGPVCLDQQSALFVNLRCMQLLKNSLVLYAGAGITPESNPQAEWRETVLKSKTLLSVLQN
ncbi:chorismate-binding protein [Anaerolineales bacterium HSG6]|nr:chorismate-binding protein [Anaerolineales bacterium HSG6]